MYPLPVVGYLTSRTLRTLSITLAVRTVALVQAKRQNIMRIRLLGKAHLGQFIKLCARRLGQMLLLRKCFRTEDIKTVNYKQ